ncbi:hypothetical protein Trydic_g4363 [Trypoxylus dichotomus]
MALRVISVGMAATVWVTVSFECLQGCMVMLEMLRLRPLNVPKGKNPKVINRVILEVRSCLFPNTEDIQETTPAKLLDNAEL